MLFMMLAVLTTSCTDSNDTKEDTQTDGNPYATFDHTKRVADSLYSCMRFRSAYNLYLHLLDSKEVEEDDEKRLSVLNGICESSELAGHKADQNKWLKQLLDLAKKTHNDYYQSLALMSMAQNVFYEGDREKGISYANKAVNLISKTNRKDTDHLLHGYLIMLARMYGEMKDYENALKTNERNLQLTMHGTRWGKGQNKQLIDRRMALAKLAAILARMGNTATGSQQKMYFQRADSAYDAWKAVQYKGNHTRDYFIVDYLKQRGRHDEAIPIYHTLIQRVRQHGDTLSEMMNTAKWGLADLYRKMGNCEQAATLYDQVLEIQDSLKNRKAKNTAQELAAIYHDQEQEQKIMQQEKENIQQRAVIIIVLLVLVAVIIATVVVARKNRIINRKNQSLASQITEALKYKEMYRVMKVQQSRQQQLTPKEEEEKEVDIALLSDEQLFHYIDDIVIREHLFCDPAFGRDTIRERFQLTKERVGAAFSKGCKEHAKLNSYIQQLRLEYAAQLLVDHPEKNMVQIAAESGFGSSAYFSNCFRQHFGMSPTDYRQNVTEQENL